MKKSENKKASGTFDLQTWEVIRAYEFEGGNISFDLKVNGVFIYGMVLVWMEDRKEYFISFPSRKGRDGKYYKHAWFQLNDTLQKAIIERIEEILS